MSASLPGGGGLGGGRLGGGGLGGGGLGGAGLGGGALYRGEHVVFLHDQVLHAVQLDLLAGVLAEEDGVARFHVQLHPIALVGHFAVARGDNCAPLRFFLGGIRDDDAADVLFAFVEALHENPVV